MTIRAIQADDGVQARQRLRNHLRAEVKIEIDGKRLTAAETIEPCGERIGS